MGTAIRVAKDVGIDKTAVWAGISPQGKKELIQQMQEQGDVVAMVHLPYLHSLTSGRRRHQRLPRLGRRHARYCT